MTSSSRDEVSRTPHLAVEVAGLSLRNPVMSASGTFGHGLEMLSFVPPEVMGALVLKTVTLQPRHGNPPPRLCETPAGLLNSIGLENRGVEAFASETWPLLANLDVPVIVNIGGESVEDFARMGRRVEALGGVAALEVNLSCPNVQGGKLPFATEPSVAAEVVAAVRASSTLPLIAKLSPNVTRIDAIAAAVEAAGADAITAINTVLGLGLDWRRRRALLGTVLGGLSGPCIKPIALRMVRECFLAVRIPIIGCGGISCAEDVLEFLVAGARAVQVGTHSFSRPDGIARIVAELEELCAAERIENLAELSGTLEGARAPRGGG